PWPIRSKRGGASTGSQGLHCRPEQNRCHLFRPSSSARRAAHKALGRRSRTNRALQGLHLRSLPDLVRRIFLPSSICNFLRPFSSSRLAPIPLLRGQIRALSRSPVCFLIARTCPHRHPVESRPEHVVREEILPIHRHHHDLQLVAQPLGNNFLDQHRI